MNRKIGCFAILLILTASLTSCTPEKVQNDVKPQPQLFGKWKAIEQYNGYVNGGDFQWHTIVEGESLEFKTNGDYVKVAPSNVPCMGRFAWQTASKSIELKVSCQVNTIVQKYSELNDNTLILDFQGREGIIRLKYKKI
jgi:hypothetical protein